MSRIVTSRATLRSGLRMLLAVGLLLSAAAVGSRVAADTPKAAATQGSDAVAASGAVVPGETAISYSLAHDCRVSLGVYDDAGRMKRVLLAGESQPAGQHSVAWDGLDAEGRPVAPGKHAWKLLESQGLKSEYMFSLGTSLRGALEWPGNHGGPSAVAFDGDRLFMGVSSCENLPDKICMSADGNAVLWMQQPYQAWGGISDMAVDGGKLYVMHGSTGRYVVADAADGRATSSKGEGVKLRAPIKRFCFGSAAPAEAGWTQVGAAAYSKDKGYGWNIAEGLTAISQAVVYQKDHEATKEDYREFVFDAPHGFTYSVKLRLGDGTHTFEKVHFYNGYGYHKPCLNSGKILTVEKETVINDNYPEKLFEAGQMRWGFNNTAANEAGQWTNDPIGKAGWAIKSIEIFTSDSRVDVWKGKAVACAVDSGAGVGAIQWINESDGEVLSEMSLAGLQDVALLGQGDAILAVAGDKVVEVAKAGATPQVRISDLTDPAYVTIDHATGDIFVVEKGKGQQIKKYGPDYKLLKTFGRPGGRRFGRYNPQDFLQVDNLACDGHGGFAVVEQSSPPRRTAHFDANGTLLNEWYGGQLFFNYANADPRNPGRVWFSSHYGTLVEAEVDWEHKSWKPYATYSYYKLLDPSLTDLAKVYFSTCVKFDILYHGDDRYILFRDLNGMLMKIDEAGGRLIPSATIGHIMADISEMPPNPWLEACKAQKLDPETHRYFTWADVNGDGQMDPNEFRLFQFGAKEYLPGAGMKFADVSMDAGWDLIQNSTENRGAGGGDAKSAAGKGGDPKSKGGEGKPGSGKTKEGEGKSGNGKAGADKSAAGQTPHPADANAPLAWPAYYTMKVQGFTPCGAPIWDWGIREKGTAVGCGEYPSFADRRVDPNGNVYAIFTGQGDGYIGTGGKTGGHGYAWPADTYYAASAFMKFDPAGHLLFQSGHHSALADSPNGCLNHPINVSGFVNGCVGVADRIVNPLVMWTDDGLYVGQLFDRRTDDGLAGNFYTWGWGPEGGLRPSAVQYDMMPGGNLFKRENGDVIFMAAGHNNVIVYKVSGWEDFNRQEGTVEVIAPAAVAGGKGDGLKGEYFSSKDFSGSPAMTHIDPQLWFGKDDTHYPKAWPEGAVTEGQFSVRWTGFVEPRFTDTYSLLMYVGLGGGGGKGSGPAEKVRVWIDGTKVLDNFDKDFEISKFPAKEGKESGPVKFVRRKLRSDPILLKAGQKVAVKIEYVKSGMGELHFCWESVSQAIEHIPQAYLYSK